MGSWKLVTLPQMAILKGKTHHCMPFGAKWPILGFPDLWYPMRRSPTTWLITVLGNFAPTKSYTSYKPVQSHPKTVTKRPQTANFPYFWPVFLTQWQISDRSPVHKKLFWAWKLFLSTIKKVEKVLMEICENSWKFLGNFQPGKACPILVLGTKKLVTLAQMDWCVLGSDLSSRASAETGCVPSFWIAMKYGVQMEWGERALGFGYHWCMYQNGMLTFDFLFTGSQIYQTNKQGVWGHFGFCDQFWRFDISGTVWTKVKC